MAVADPVHLNIVNIFITYSAFLLSAAMMLYSASKADLLEGQLEIEHEKSEDSLREEGLPYQTLIASILHNYVNGRLVDRRLQ